MKEMRQKDGQAGRSSKVRRLARLNSRITQLGSELETLQFMQDRLERELAPFSSGDKEDRRHSVVRENAFGAPPLRGKPRGGGAAGRAKDEE